MARRIQSHWIAGPVGRLEALLEEPEDTEPRSAALVCHPHPKHGGTMHNKVVHRLARGLRAGGAVALRFNYRAVNLSAGSYAGGIGEIADARACLEWLRERYASLPYLLAGFSFGARIVQKLGCAAAGARRVIAAGFPTGYLEKESFAECAAPRVFVQSTHDEYGPRAELQAFVDGLGRQASVVWIEARNHFFTGGLDELERVVRWIAEEQDQSSQGQAVPRSKTAAPSLDSRTHRP